MKLIKRFNEDTNIKWWSENRKIANKAIDKYNLWQLGKVESIEVYVEFGLSYISLSGDVDYPDEFDTMKEQLMLEGYDLSFYHGF